MKLSRYVVTTRPFTPPQGDTPWRLAFSTRSLRLIALPDATWQAVKSAEFHRVAPATIESLSDASFLVGDHDDELAHVLRRNRDAIALNRTLYEAIQPSAACQLGCGYCGQAHTARLLSAADQDAIVERIGMRLADGRFSALQLGWFGGEPLLGMSVIRTLTPRVAALARDASCAFDARMVTNGMRLSPDCAAELVESLHVRRFEITLDGPRRAHDARRATKGGAPTFDRILSNVRALATRFVPTVRVVVRCNVDASNAGDVSDLIDLLSDLGLQEKVDLYFAPVHDWGNTAGGGALDAADFAGREIEWLAHMMDRGFNVPLLPAAKPIVCMAVSPSAELIDPFGSVFNCTEVSLVPAYGDPNTYSLGHLLHPRTSLEASGLSGFLGEVEQGRYGCSGCPLLPVCGGGCPKAWRDGEAPCPSMKHNLGDRMLLAWSAAAAMRTSEAIHDRV